MSERSHIDRVWDIIENVAVCMLTTRFEGGLRARPLEVRPDRSSNRLLFVADVHSPKREEVERWPEVGLVFIDAAQRAYLSKNQWTAGRRMPGRTDSAVAHTPVRSMHGPCKDRVTGSAVQAIRPLL